MIFTESHRIFTLHLQVRSTFEFPWTYILYYKFSFGLAIRARVHYNEVIMAVHQEGSAASGSGKRPQTRRRRGDVTPRPANWGSGSISLALPVASLRFGVAANNSLVVLLMSVTLKLTRDSHLLKVYNEVVLTE